MSDNDHWHYASDIHGGAEQHHRHHDLERDDETAQRDIRRLQEDVRELRAALELAEERISGLDRLRPTCTVCQDATATQQTASGPACADCVGDPDDDGESEAWGDRGPSESYEAWIAEGRAMAMPEPEPYDPGPEVDDEGGMSEHRYLITPEEPS